MGINVQGTVSTSRESPGESRMRVLEKVDGRILEASVLRNTSAPALSGINAMMRGLSTRLISSRGLGWGSVCLEVHRAFPAERKESKSDYHLIALITNHVAAGENSVSRGCFLPYSYSPGAINLYPAGLIPACRAFTETKMIVCAIDPMFVNEVGRELGSPSVTEFRLARDIRDRSIAGIVMLLAEEARSGGLSGNLYTEHLVHALALRFLWRAGGARGIEPVRREITSNRALRRVLARMEAELAMDLDLKTLAAESGYSRSHFLRVFRSEVGCSPHQWLTRLRVKQAKRMLRENRLSLIDIAAECGFSSHAHLSRTFRRAVGVVPNQYRRTPELFM